MAPRRGDPPSAEAGPSWRGIDDARPHVKVFAASWMGAARLAPVSAFFSQEDLQATIPKRVLGDRNGSIGQTRRSAHHIGHVQKNNARSQPWSA